MLQPTYWLSPTRYQNRIIFNVLVRGAEILLLPLILISTFKSFLKTHFFVAFNSGWACLPLCAHCDRGTAEILQHVLFCFQLFYVFVLMCSFKNMHLFMHFIQHFSQSWLFLMWNMCCLGLFLCRPWLCVSFNLFYGASNIDRLTLFVFYNQFITVLILSYLVIAVAK